MANLQKNDFTHVKRRILNLIKTYIRFFLNKRFRDIYLFEKTGKQFKPYLPDFPPMVMIDTTTRCNMVCFHCPNSVLSRDKSWVGDMDRDLYNKIIDEVAIENPNTYVRPFDGGEPLMRKDIEDLIQYAKDKGIKKVSITTNGLLLNQTRAHRIIEAGLDHIEFSVDALTVETYKKIRNSKHFNKVINNINNFIDMKNKLRPSLKISVSFVKQKDNLHEEDSFIKYWRKQVDDIGIREYHQHNDLVDSHGRYLKKDNFLHRYPCPYLWDRIIIQHDGSVRFCEADWKAEHKIGDVKNQSLREIWLGEEYRYLRNTHVDGTFNHPFCKKCTDWKEIHW